MTRPLAALPLLALLSSSPALAQTPAATPPAPSDAKAATVPAAPDVAPAPAATPVPLPIEQPTVTPADAPRNKLSYLWRVDAPLAVSATTFWVLTEVNKKNLAAATCRFCAPNSLDAAVTDALGWQDIKLANTFGNVFAYGLVPAGTLGLLGVTAVADGRADELPGDVLVMAEAVSLSAVVNQSVKFLAGRERPFVHALPADQKSKTDQPADNNLSFYSGHSNFAFSLAVSAGTIATIQDYKLKWPIWGVGVPLAAFTAYSRIGAKKHYFTDVLVGSAMGAGFGFAIPWVFHRADAKGISLTAIPSTDGAAIAGRF